jgi:hypothetical protein
MKNAIIYLIGFIFLISVRSSFGQAMCSFSAMEGSNFDYTVDFELAIDDVVIVQNGTSCGVTVDVDYLITLTENIPSQFGPVFFINLVVGCVGADNNTIDITVPGGNLSSGNPSVNGILPHGEFDFPNTDCSSLIVTCDVGVTMQGGGGLGEVNSPCGTITTACARSIF